MLTASPSASSSFGLSSYCLRRRLVSMPDSSPSPLHRRSARIPACGLCALRVGPEALGLACPSLSPQRDGRLGSAPARKTGRQCPLGSKCPAPHCSRSHCKSVLRPICSGVTHLIKFSLNRSSPSSSSSSSPASLCRPRCLSSYSSSSPTTSSSPSSENGTGGDDGGKEEGGGDECRLDGPARPGTGDDSRSDERLRFGLFCDEGGMLGED